MIVVLPPPGADERDRAAGLDREAQAVEDGPAGFVLETHVAKLDAPVELSERRRVRTILPVRLAIDQREHPLGPGHRGERLIVLIAEHGNRGKERIGEEQELDQRVERNAPAERLIPPDHQQDREEELPVQLEQRLEDRRLLGSAVVIARVIVDQLLEQLAVQILADEALDLSDPGHAFRQLGCHATEALLLSSVGAAQTHSEVADECP
jgi:hypothetical protein